MCASIGSKYLTDIRSIAGDRLNIRGRTVYNKTRLVSVRSPHILSNCLPASSICVQRVLKLLDAISRFTAISKQASLSSFVSFMPSSLAVNFLPVLPQPGTATPGKQHTGGTAARRYAENGTLRQLHGGRRPQFVLQVQEILRGWITPVGTAMQGWRHLGIDHVASYPDR